MNENYQHIHLDYKENDSINYDQLAQDILISLRGDFSQRELSSKLGFSFNQVGKWESGHSRIKWDHFCDIIELKHQVEFSTLLSVHETSQNYHYRSDVLKYYIYKHSLHVIKDLGKNDLVKKHLKSKNKQIDLSTVLELLDIRRNILIYELSQFVDCKQIKILDFRYSKYKERLTALESLPMIPIIRACLLIESYQKLKEHNDTLIQIHTGVTEDDIKSCLIEMQNHGEIEYHNNKFFVVGPGYSFSQTTSDYLKPFNKKMIELSALKYPLKPSEWDNSFNRNLSRSSVFVEAISDEVSVEISDLISEMHGRILEILKKDQTVYKDSPKENIQLIINMSQSTAWLNQQMKNDLNL